MDFFELFKIFFKKKQKMKQSKNKNSIFEKK